MGRGVDMKVYDNEMAEKQRQADERYADSGSRRHWGEMLQNISGSWARHISVLDVGCGTGRFFWCLRNVEFLLGVDLSPYMLEQARKPLRAERIDIGRIELVCADIFNLDLSGKKFDFVYSIGVLGECAPFSAVLCQKLLGSLQSGGKMFVTIVDAHSRFDGGRYSRKAFAIRVLGKLFPFLPQPLRRYINRQCASKFMTRSEIETCFRMVGANKFTIEAYQHPVNTGWQGTHYDCLVEIE
jgi:ubiquinone/menaquinone biosynthesis C-methylase UbiE